MIPNVNTYSVQNTAGNEVNTMRMREIIGYISIETASQGIVQAFRMNPATLRDTRLGNLAVNYQEYRFSKLALNIVPGTSTSTSGQFVAGFDNNPDSECSTAAQVAALPGSKLCTLWQGEVIPARLTESKWLKVDADSDQTINTTQGVFFFCLISANLTGSLIVPIQLEYTVHFRGSAVATQIGQSTTVAMPLGTLARNVSINTAWVYTAATAAAPVPALNKPYFLNPLCQVPVTTDGVNIDLVAGAVVVIGGITGTGPFTYGMTFYESLEDWQNGSPITSPGPLGAIVRGPFQLYPAF